MLDKEGFLEHKRAVVSLRELLAHPGWELVRTKALQDQYGSQGEVLWRSKVRELEGKMNSALRRNDVGEARYFQGRLEQLRDDVEGKLVTWLIEQLA